MTLPVPEFTPWFPWSYLDGATPPDIAVKLRQVGCYLLARFDGEPPEGPADPADPKVFYIGETHGNTTSLWGRLSAFGNSAGFYGGQWNGHYAAWRYPDLFPEDVLGVGVEGQGKSCSSGHVFVALCPWPGGMAECFRGIFPTIIEQQVIWIHTEANGQIPRLNNSGRVQDHPAPAAPPMPEIPDPELDDALARATRPQAAEHAVMSIAQRLAVGMEYDPNRAAQMARYGNWSGAERRLGNEYIYIGWSDATPGEVTFAVYRRNTCLYDGGSAGTRDDLRNLLQAFWNLWSI